MEELLIWVDENDKVTGYGRKMQTHIAEQLHRAFSVFLYNEYDRKLLIHRRAAGKYHSGGLWTNSCCSHPRKGEDIKDAVVRRLKEELGFCASDDELFPADNASGHRGLREVGKFTYYEKYDGCAEHEIDHVFWLPVNRKEVKLDPDEREMSEIKWISMDELTEWLKERPDDFTAWFAPALSIILDTAYPFAV